MICHTLIHSLTHSVNQSRGRTKMTRLAWPLQLWAQPHLLMMKSARWSKEGEMRKTDATHPYKAGREPALFIVDLSPPPVLVGGIEHLDNVSRFKRQLPVGHGDVIPYCLGTDNRTATDQLERQTQGPSATFSSPREKATSTRHPWSERMRKPCALHLVGMPAPSF